MNINYPPYVPKWYDPEISYLIQQQYGDKSKEHEDYLKEGKIPEDKEW